MTKTLILFIASAISLHCFGSELDCADATGKWTYADFMQEGGVCCGRETTDLSFDGKALKQTVRVNEGGAIQGSFTDSNPNLTITRGTETDLGNTVVDHQHNRRVKHVALDLTLQTTDGSPVLAGNSSASVVIQMTCTLTSYIFPVP